MASRTPVRRSAMAAAGIVAVVALPLAACGGPDRLEGTVVAVDDTGGKARPLAGGWIAVFDDDSLSAYLAQSGIDAPGSTDLPYAAGRVLHDDVADAGGVLAPIDDQGRFTLTATGQHTLCRLVEAPQVDLLKGCAVVELPANGRLKVTSGEGALTATVDS